MSDRYDWPHLLSLAVHEFRTPASIIAGYLRMLERDTDPALSDRQGKMVTEASRSCERLVAIIAELSDVAKLETGALGLAHEPFDIFARLADVAEGVQEGWDRGVRIELRGDAAGATIAGDPSRLCAALGTILRAIAREQGSSCTIAVNRQIVTRGDDMQLCRCRYSAGRNCTGCIRRGSRAVR